MRKALKRLALAALLLAGIVLVWYGQSRLLAPFRCVSIVEVGASTEVSEVTSALVLAAYNIAHGRGGEQGASNWTGNSRKEILQHLGDIAQQVREQEVDILVLNEVDLDSSWSGGINQARAIAEKAGLAWCSEQRNMDVSFPFRRYCFGNAVLSRYPITDAQVVRFPALSMKEQVLAGDHDGLLVTVAAPSGDIAVLAVHLEYRCEDVRVNCARIIEDLVSESSMPFVAMGDFNSSPSFAKGQQVSAEGLNAVDVLLESGLLKVGEDARDAENYLTFPTGKPGRAIDWILCSPEFEHVNTAVVESGLSDHLMVVGRVKKLEGDEP